MRKSLFLLYALLALPAAAQHYTVNGVAPQGVDEVYMRRLENHAVDTVAVQNGKFRFEGEADGRIFGSLFYKGCDDPVYAILEGNLTIDFEKRTTTGTAENDSLTVWEARIRPTRIRFREAMKEYGKYYESNEQAADSVTNRLNAVFDTEEPRLIELTKACCRTNPDMKFPAIAFARMMPYMENADIVALAGEGNPAYMQTKFLEVIKPQVAGLKRQMPGSPLPDIELADTLGQTHKLSEFVGNGKYVLIDFWASWCGPCRAAMPGVKRIYETYKDKGFDIVGISLDDDAAAWKGSVKKLELPWHHLSDLKGWASKAAGTYGVNAIPITILYGPDGKVVEADLSEEELEAKLQELLK